MVIKNDIRILGIPDTIVEHGTPKELHRECGYDTPAIIETIRDMMKDTVMATSFFQ